MVSTTHSSFKYEIVTINNSNAEVSPVGGFPTHQVIPSGNCKCLYHLLVIILKMYRPYESNLKKKSSLYIF